METTELIEKGIAKNLNKSDQEDFNNRISTDLDFAKKVKDEAYILNALDEVKAEELKQRLERIEEEDTQNRTHPLLKWAAVFAFFMMGATWFLWSNQQTTEELFLSYYTIYPNVEAPIVRSDANQQGAWRLYDNENYNDAYLQFQYSVSQGNTDEATWFYLGVCALELNHYNQATQAFTNVIDKKDGKYAPQASWYLALTNLKSKNLDEAKILLVNIGNSSSSYASKANELLSKF